MQRAIDHQGMADYGSYDVVTMSKINDLAGQLQLPLPYPGISRATPQVQGEMCLDYWLKELFEPGKFVHSSLSVCN
jgi:hypothetical protein